MVRPAKVHPWFGIPRFFSDGFWEQIDAAKIPFYPWYALVNQALAIENPLNLIVFAWLHGMWGEKSWFSHGSVSVPVPVLEVLDQSFVRSILCWLFGVSREGCKSQERFAG